MIRVLAPSLVDLVRAAPGTAVVVEVEEALPPVSLRPPSSSEAVDEPLLSVNRSRRESVDDGLIAPRLEVQ